MIRLPRLLEDANGWEIKKEIQLKEDSNFVLKSGSFPGSIIRIISYSK